jgi:heme-degrading monooxygenase HmoA
MIARLWCGRTLAKDGDTYEAYIVETGVQAQRASPGNLLSAILRQDDESETRFTVFSLWESWEAVRGFAGADVDTAVYYPEDTKYLLALEPTVVHWEVPVWASDAALGDKHFKSS